MNRFTIALALIAVAAVSLIATLTISYRPVRIETHTVKQDPGPPDNTVPGEAINPELAGRMCDLWVNGTGVTIVCKA